MSRDLARDRMIDLGSECHLAVADDPESPVVAITGELDLSNAALLRLALYDIALAQPAWLIVDAGELTFLDARSLEVLSEVDAWLRQTGSHGLRVRNPARIVRRLLDITGQEHLVEPRHMVGAGTRSGD